jgi:hypothetical protein
VPRAAWIALSVALAAIVVLLTGAAFLIGTGSDAKVDGGTLPQAPQGTPGRLQLPLARDSQALMLAQSREPVLIGLAARPGGPVEVGVLDGEREQPRSTLSFRVGGDRVQATPCGFGCSRLQAPVLAGRPEVVTVAVRGKPEARFQLPARLPPSGAALFRRVERRMRSLRAYEMRERLSSGVGGALTTTFEARAPNRLRLRTSSGSRTVLIGTTRWDRVDGRWERSSFPGLSTRTFMWDGAFNARLVGSEGSARILSAFDFQPVPAWFRLAVGPDGRVREARMVAASHFMVQQFGRFDAPIRIEPPR